MIWWIFTCPKGFHRLQITLKSKDKQEQMKVKHCVQVFQPQTSELGKFPCRSSGLQLPLKLPNSYFFCRLTHAAGPVFGPGTINPVPPCESELLLPPTPPCRDPVNPVEGWSPAAACEEDSVEGLKGVFAHQHGDGNISLWAFAVNHVVMRCCQGN